MEHSVGGIDSTGKQQVRRGWEIIDVTCFAMWISIGRWCLGKKQGFVAKLFAKPYCSMQMDLYKNNLTAAHYVHLKTYSNYCSKYQYFILPHIWFFSPASSLLDFHYLGPRFVVWRPVLDSRMTGQRATRNLTPKVTQKLDTFNSYLLTFSQYLMSTLNIGRKLASISIREHNERTVRKI